MARMPRRSSARPRPRGARGRRRAFGLWLRDVSLAKPGRYEVEATAGDKPRRDLGGVRHPRGRAKNVILFVGDGLSIAHRTAARICRRAGRRPLRRRARDRRHAAHGAGLDLRHRLDRHRQRQRRERLHDRPQVLRQRAGRLLRAEQERPRSSKVETIAELVKRTRGLSVGVVTNTEIRTRRRPRWWPTPAAAPTTTTS